MALVFGCLWTTSATGVWLFLQVLNREIKFYLKLLGKNLPPPKKIEFHTKKASSLGNQYRDCAVPYVGYFLMGGGKFRCDSMKHKVIPSLNHNEIYRIPYENASRTGLRNLCIGMAT